GDGIISSLANAGAFAVGYAEASAVNVSDLLGQGVDSTTVLIRYTRYGDANLDGVVNALDFNALASRFGQSGKLCRDGEWNYDGTVNTLDLNVLAANLNSTLAAPLPQFGVVVPEPVVLAPFLLPILARRWRSPLTSARRGRDASAHAEPVMT